MGEAGVIDESFFRRYRELLDAEDAAFDELEHAYEDGDRATFDADLAHWQSSVERRAAFLERRGLHPALDVDLLVVQSRDDERNSVTDAQEVIPLNPRARLVLVDGLTHRRAARDPDVINLVADFVACDEPSTAAASNPS